MKLWKMNAILIMLSLALCSCTETQESLSLEKKGPHILSDPYAENDNYLNKVEQSELNPVSEEAENDISEMDEIGKTFLETSGPNVKKMLNKKKKASKLISKKNLSKIRRSIKTLKPEKKRKASGLRLVRVANPRLAKEDSKFETFTNCGKKTGFLNIVKNIDHSGGELRVSPVYIDMSTNSMKFYSSPTNTQTLFNVVKLDKILRISQQKILENHSCFEIILADYAENSKGLSKENVSLCANTKEKMKSWIDTIGAFKECQVNVNNVDHNRKILVDFQKVNELTKVAALGLGGKGAFPGATVGNPEDTLYYDNLPTINKSAIKLQKDTSLKHEIDKILGFVKKSTIQQSQVQRKMQNELKEAKKFSEEVHEKQEIIRKILERRAEKEKLRQQSLIQSEEKFKELKLLKAVENKIVQMKKKEIQEYSEQYQKQIKEERSKANSESKKMMKSLMEEEKRKPYNDCTDTRILLFEDKSYIKERCTVFYGEHKGDECEVKENFCNMCCSHHVGRKFYDQVTDCKKKCNGLINGIDWTLTQKKGEKGFDETNKSNTAKSSNTKDSKTPAQKDSKKTDKARKDSKKTNKGKDGKNTNKGKDNKKTGKNKNKKTNPDALLEKLAKQD